MTNLSSPLSSERSLGDGGLVGFFSTVIIALAGLLLVAAQFSLA